MTNRQKLRQIIQEEMSKLREAAKPSLMNIQLENREIIEDFVGTILKKSNGYVKNDKDAALLLIQILKNIYKI